MMPSAIPAQAERLGFAGGAYQAVETAVPVEHPVSIVYGTVPYAVMMATPADIEDFAVGFSFTEGVVDHAADVRDIAVEETEKGLVVSLVLAPERFSRHLARTRSLSGRTGCGVCGIGTLDELPQAMPVASPASVPDATALERAIRDLDASQPINAATRAVHGAAWCGFDGSVRRVREDVGRHNALDKLIGALLRAGERPEAGFLLITSRCSFEMVEKAARFGVRTLVAVSAPTSLALERAETLGLGLIAVARRDAALVFSGPLPATHQRDVA